MITEDRHVSKRGAIIVKQVRAKLEVLLRFDRLVPVLSAVEPFYFTNPKKNICTCIDLVQYSSCLLLHTLQRYLALACLRDFCARLRTEFN